MRNLWVFFRDPSGRWRWQYRDGAGQVALRAKEGFATVEEAELDAQFFGYSLVQSPGGAPHLAERRKSLGVAASMP